MSDEFAAPPAPDGTPAGTVRRSDFRATPPARRRRGFPLWVAVLLGVGLLVIVGGVAAQLTLSARSANLTPADPGATGRLHSAQLVSGMCIESIGSAAGVVRVVACEEPHSAEVVTTTTLTGTDFPGEDAVAKSVLDYCASQLAPGGPLAAAAEGRSWVAWAPSDRTWRAGDRSGLCIVSSDSPWTGNAGVIPDHSNT